MYISTKSSFAIAALFVSLTTAWQVGMYETQNSCGGDWAPDTTRKGEAGQSSSCTTIGFPEPKAMNVSDWDDGCRVGLYDNSCNNLIKEFKKEDADLVDNNWSCINQLQSINGMENFGSIMYTCG